MVNDVWLVVVDKDSSKTNIVSGPKSLNTSKLIDEGWYFFSEVDKKANLKLSPEKAIKLACHITCNQTSLRELVQR